MKSNWKNFTLEELACKCGKCGVESGLMMNPRLMDNVQRLRDIVGPLIISSAYRCPNHPEEAKKDDPGEHSDGDSVDLRADGARALLILKTSLSMGCFPRVGVNQKGSRSGRFIHLGMSKRLPNPALWTY